MRFFAGVCAFFCFVLSPGFSFELKPEHVAIVYNEDSPDGRFLAETYAKLRKVPSENLVALSCPLTEAISQDSYHKTIREPLLRTALAKKWWRSSSLKRGEINDRRIFAIVLMKGMPLKIVGDSSLKKTGAQTDAAAVDSELALLAFNDVPTPGMIMNSYYEKEEEIVGSGFPYFLVSRIDSPDRETCLSMMHDSVDVEKRGLWGWLVVDKGGPYQQGNQWMDKIVAEGEDAGIPVMFDEWGYTLPSHYPLGNDTAVYFGWYAGTVNGPFLAKEFRFKRGAIAVHLHSFSAATVRSKDQYWAGPLLARGAAVTLGNVFEPYLDTTHHFDLFFDRLLKGYTVAEAAGMSIRVWSWQNVVFGDPLYRPFARMKEKQIIKSESDKYFQAWRFASQNWKEIPEKFEKNVSEAAIGSPGGMFLYESLGNRFLIRKDWLKAGEYFSKALSSASSRKDRIRIRMSVAEMLRRKGDKKGCLDELNALIGLYPETEWSPAFVETKNRVQPPPPPPPPIQGKNPVESPKK